MTVEGGRAYAIGDRVVAIAPNAGAGIVTSEQLTVLDVSARHLTVRTATGRHVHLAGDAIDTEHLDYGYAVTVHRAQGATFDRTHVLATGGGRELAYVALSRAREGTTIYATADDLRQAVVDLQVDWRADRAQRWITVQRPPNERRTDALRRVAVLERDTADLRTGSGRWHDTPAGAAARQLVDADDELRRAQRTADDPSVSRRERRIATRALPQLRDALDGAERRWQEVGQPIADQLAGELGEARRDLGRRQVEALRTRIGDAVELHRRPGQRGIEQDRDVGLGW